MTLSRIILRTFLDAKNILLHKDRLSKISLKLILRFFEATLLTVKVFSLFKFFSIGAIAFRSGDLFGLIFPSCGSPELELQQQVRDVRKEGQQEIERRRTE